MSPGLRLLAAIALIAFLVVFGMLTAMQELRNNNIVDPVIAELLGDRILPIEAIGGALPYQSQDYRDRFGMASAYYRTGDGETDGILLILSSMLPENFREDGDWDQGIQKEWEEGEFHQVGATPSQEQFYFQGQAVIGQGKVFQANDGAQRNQFVVPVLWGKQMVWVQVNGPTELVTLEAVQAMLDSVEGEPVPLLDVIEDPYAEETDEPKGTEQ